MKGSIAFANADKRRYAVLTESGDYTTFELVNGAPLHVGQPVTGDFERIATTTYVDDLGEEMIVASHDVQSSRMVAAAWTAGER